tara:strand:+ start:17014 stop:18018 length:1005 start_codon:yes stop_codon:yes gene_type:complete
MVKTSFIAKIISSVLSLFILSFVAGCGQDPVSVRIGYLPIAAELPLFVAVEQGYFADEGINVELIRMASSNDLANAATAGRVDVLAGAASNVVFDVGTTSGQHHELILLNPYSNAPGHVTDYLIARDAALTPDIPSLEGKRVASFPGSVNRIFVRLIFEKYGLAWGNYEYVEMLPANWEPALASGAIDAVSALEPSATQIIEDGAGVSIFSGLYADLMPNVPLSGHWLSRGFIDTAEPETLASVLRAYERAVQFIRQNEDQAKQYLVTYANVREDILDHVNLNPWMTLGEIQGAEVQNFADLLAREGALLQPIDVNDFIYPGDQRGGEAANQAN